MLSDVRRVVEKRSGLKPWPRCCGRVVSENIIERVQKVPSRTIFVHRLLPNLRCFELPCLERKEHIEQSIS